jgi:hypothetical protein
MQNPSEADFTRARRVLHYIAHTMEIGYIWEVKGDFENIEENTVCNHVSAHADSDFAGRLIDSRSTTGYIMNFGSTGSFMCVTKMQRSVTLSSTHAEIVCACECDKSVEWVRGFISEIGMRVTKPTVMYQDNSAAIELSQNPVYHFRTRHFRVAQHYLRELENNYIITTIKKRSEGMWADLMNKPHPPLRHVMLRKQIMGE